MTRVPPGVELEISYFAFFAAHPLFFPDFYPSFVAFSMTLSWR